MKCVLGFQAEVCAITACASEGSTGESGSAYAPTAKPP